LLREELKACITDVLDQEFEPTEGKGTTFARIKTFVVGHSDVKAMTKDLPAVESILHTLLIPRAIRGICGTFRAYPGCKRGVKGV
jgi:hypothetical protein